MNKITIVLIAVLISAALIGCEKKTEKADEMLVYCGAGIRPPVAEVVEIFAQANNIEIITDYAGSEVLLAKIKLTGRGDLYMPGDKYYVDQASEIDLIDSQAPVCYFVPTILVGKDNPLDIANLVDLLKPGVRLGLGDSKACAIGRKTKKIFEKNNISWADVEKNLKFQSQTVNELGMQIQAGSLDAVIVWDAVAAYYTEHGKQIVIPTDQNVISTVEIGILKSTKNPQMAEKFMTFITSDQAREIFKKHNYRVSKP
ncbi:MAG: molybdate ABC transporter substrate-binding protein [Anaerohalosphaera sp.]|nr:molybdate ABC transporter substrate-binding protein [Anaerohalosphaera sp.]